MTVDWDACKTKEVVGPISGVSAVLLLWFTVLSPMVDAQLNPIEDKLEEIKGLALDNKSELDKRETIVFDITKLNTAQIAVNTDQLNTMHGNQRVICHALEVECK